MKKCLNCKINKVENGLVCCGTNSKNKCHYKYGHVDECSTGYLASLVCQSEAII